MRLQLNGTVESFNGRIEDAPQSHHCCTGEDLEQALLRYLYNSQLQKSVLNGRSSIIALKDWRTQRPEPELFRKRVYNQAGCNT
ncbi:hypothetical protein [Tritonibacter mobilis]|uniref:hypothetical protein n=1 Tax=Tritonibacter mobilis TaxID=379347 RepID=UPI003A5BAB8E